MRNTRTATPGGAKAKPKAKAPSTTAYRPHGRRRGTPKTGGGSRKGVRNTYSAASRIALTEHIKQLVAQGHAFADPAHLFITTYMDPDVDLGVRLRAAEVILDRILPRLKAVEHTGDSGGPVRIKVALQWDATPPGTDDASGAPLDIAEVMGRMRQNPNTSGLGDED